MPLKRELLAEDALVQGVALVEQHGELLRAILADVDAGDVAYFLGIRRRGHAAAIRLLDLDRDLGVVTQQRAAPAAGAEGRDRRQRKDISSDRQDRAMR